MCRRDVENVHLCSEETGAKHSGKLEVLPIASVFGWRLGQFILYDYHYSLHGNIAEVSCEQELLKLSVFACSAWFTWHSKIPC